jgi:hypothetical protein
MMMIHFGLLLNPQNNHGCAPLPAAEEPWQRVRKAGRVGRARRRGDRRIRRASVHVVWIGP